MTEYSYFVGGGIGRGYFSIKPENHPDEVTEHRFPLRFRWNRESQPRRRWKNTGGFRSGVISTISTKPETTPEAGKGILLEFFKTQSRRFWLSMIKNKTSPADFCSWAAIAISIFIFLGEDKCNGLLAKPCPKGSITFIMKCANSWLQKSNECT